MIAARGADHAGEVRVSRERIGHEIQAAAHLECADGRVVLVLHPHLASGALREQRPRKLRRRAHRRVDVARGGFDVGEGGRAAGGRHDCDCKGYAAGRRSARRRLVASSARRARSTAGIVLASVSCGISMLIGASCGTARTMPARSSPPSPGSRRSARAWCNRALAASPAVPRARRTSGCSAATRRARRESRSRCCHRGRNGWDRSAGPRCRACCCPRCARPARSSWHRSTASARGRVRCQAALRGRTAQRSSP